MNVLFVSQTRFSETPFRDGSTRHRCYTMAEALQSAGHLADVTTLDQLQLVSLSRYDVVSIQQPSASRKLLNLLDRCKKQNIRTVADLDTLAFDPTLAPVSAKSRIQTHAEIAVKREFMLCNIALKEFDEVSVATEALAQRRREIAPSQPVYVAPTALSNYWLSCHDHLSLSTASTKRIGYFPSSRGLCADFNVAAKSLSQYLKADDDRHLFLVGPLEISDEQFPTNKVERGAWVHHMDLPESLSACHANLLPHQDNSINYAQAHTSFIEAAAFGVPTISSATAQLAEHDVPGLFIAQTDEQWLDSLEALSDKEFYQHCQQSLYAYARKHCRASDSARILIKQWTAKKETTRNETTTRLSEAS